MPTSNQSGGLRQIDSPATESRPEGSDWLDAFWETTPPLISEHLPVRGTWTQQLPRPEPGTVFLLLAALATALWQQRRGR